MGEEKRRKLAGRIALDELEAGDDAFLERSGGRITSKLPEGLKNSRVMEDIVQIAWPSFVELMLTQLVSMVDMMMVGGLGPWALSAVGLTNQPKFLLMTMFIAMNVGATALVARAKGAGDQEKANRVVRQALMLNFVFGLTASVLGFIFARPMVVFMGGQEQQVIDGATAYLKIQMIGFTFMALTSTITAVLRGVGDSRTAMIYNLIANLTNCFLNWVLIYGHLGAPALGVAGASWATIIGQGVAFVIASFVILRGRGYLRLELSKGFMPDFHLIREFMAIGIPSMIEQLIMRVGMVIYAKTVASLGTVAYATHNVCMNIQAFSFMNGQAFAVSATSLVGQSLGKKRPDMAGAYSSRTQKLGMAVSMFLVVLFIFGGRWLMGLYSEDAEVIEKGTTILRMVALLQPLQSSQFIFAGALRGAGDTRSTAIITFITVLLVRPITAIVCIKVFHMGLIGAWVAMVCDQFLRSLLVGIRYYSGKWTRAYKDPNLKKA